ncbi:MAG: hypothetical protein QOG41_455 [Thermoleophilaceae bacterium]|jgi:hypothetical protein|nr:hypothetical protein [Thermoleophilaceae bacterium]MEA2353656.1 hypothetical protein [Thermoleophilaceae bacterium]MEA2387682.1 hypothetical protein [Thermoleophilaceae bacterium]
MARIRATVTLAAALVALALPATAAADYHRVIRDCAQDGKLDRHYGNHELQQAHDNVPTDIAEYTDCKAVIAAAMTNGGSGSSTGPGSGGGSGGVTTDAGAHAASAGDAAALKSETSRAEKARPSVGAAGQTLVPASSGLDHVAGSANKLPVPLIVAILAIALLCAVGGIAAAWRRWPALLRAPLRLIRR